MNNGHIIHARVFSADLEKFSKVAENANLSKKDLRVFIFICGRVGSKYYTRIDRKQISKSLNMDRKDVDKALDNLQYENIIEEGSDEHAKNGFKMCYVE